MWTNYLFNFSGIFLKSRNYSSPTEILDIITAFPSDQSCCFDSAINVGRNAGNHPANLWHCIKTRTRLRCWKNFRSAELFQIISFNTQKTSDIFTLSPVFCLIKNTSQHIFTRLHIMPFIQFSLLFPTYRLILFNNSCIHTITASKISR